MFVAAGLGGLQEVRRATKTTQTGVAGLPRILHRENNIPSGDGVTILECLTPESSESSAESDDDPAAALSCSSYSFCKMLRTIRSGPVSSASMGKANLPIVLNVG